MTQLIPDKEYFSIGETSRLTQVKPHVLRYWESEFRLLRPARRESGHRKFTRRDVDTILKIKNLLYDNGFTIPGAKKALQQENRKPPEQFKMELGENSAAVELLKSAKQTVEEILDLVK
mgnify:FL=1